MENGNAPRAFRQTKNKDGLTGRRQGCVTPTPRCPLSGGLCCKTPKMAWSDFSAKRATKRQSPIDVSSSALPKLPVSSSPVAAVPHTIIRSPRLQLRKFVFSDPKRVLQHYRH